MSRCPTGRVAAEVAPVTEGVSATEIASAAGEEGRAAPGHVAATATAAVTAAAGAVPPRTGKLVFGFGTFGCFSTNFNVKYERERLSCAFRAED